MSNFETALSALDLQRTICFVSFSSKNKEIATKFIERFDELKIKQWAMYSKTGKSTNISGDNYQRIIRKRAASTCLVVVLVSKDSLASEEVKEEVTYIKSEKKANKCTNPVIKIVHVIIDDTKPEEIPEYLLDDSDDNGSKVIAHQYNPNRDPEGEKFNTICDEIREQYICSIFENATERIRLIKNSNKFTDLLNKCIQHKCETNYVSEDIKNSIESERSGENEIHVLSNELKAYDYNTYSLMLISGNLLGEPKRTGDLFVFDPKNEGAQYFYYVTEKYLPEAEDVVRHLKGFIKKDRDSRLRVTSFIRKDFSLRNKLKDFFVDNFNGRSVEDIISYFGVDHYADSVDSAVRKQLIDLFNDDSICDYLALDLNGGEESRYFSIPKDFLTWLDGSDPVGSYSNRNTIVNNFINFLGHFIKTLEYAKEGSLNAQAFPDLKNHYRNLVYLQKLERWQCGEYMRPSESKTIVNYLLTKTSDVVDFKRDYVHLESWMSFSYDENHRIVEIPDETVEEAFKRCHLIVVDDYDPTSNNLSKRLLKLCYSFVLFIGKEGLTGAWYTTGTESALANEELGSLVTTYSITGMSTDGYNELIDAFNYLIAVNPKAKEILEEAGSKIFRYAKK